MPLEFPCYRCGRSITLPDNLPEQMIPCPHCGALIAHGGTGSSGQARMEYTANTDQFWQVSPSEPKISAFTLSSVLEEAWNIGTKRWQPLLLLGVIVGGVTMIITSAITFFFMFLFYGGLIGLSIMNGEFSYDIHDIYRSTPYQVAQNAAEDTETDAPFPEHIAFPMDDVVFDGKPLRSPSVEALAVFGIGGIIVFTAAMLGSLVFCWIYAGEIMMVLAIARGEEAPVSLLFKGWKYFWRIVLVCANRTILLMIVWFIITLVTFFPVLYYVAALGPSGTPSTIGMIFVVLEVVLGFTLLTVCTLYISAVFMLSDFFVVDRNQGAIEAMRSSYIFVRPHFWKVLGTIFLLMAIGCVAGFIPVVGSFLLIPVSIMVWAVLYLKATGQKNCLTHETQTVLPSP